MKSSAGEKLLLVAVITVVISIAGVMMMEINESKERRQRIDRCVVTEYESENSANNDSIMEYCEAKEDVRDH